MAINIQHHIEAIIFASEQAVSLKDIKTCLINTVVEGELKNEEIEKAIRSIKEKYDAPAYAFGLSEIAGGYQFLTKKDYFDTVAFLVKQKARKRLSTAALETLSIIAYKQPVTKAEIEQIRGVNSDYSVQKLLEKELIVIAGKAKQPGAPIIYSTSPDFLDYLGLKSIDELPQLKDIKADAQEVGVPEKD